MKVVQVRLEKDGLVQVAWIEKKQSIKVGCSVELKEDNSNLWKVTDIYGESGSENINRSWHVGGL